MRTITRVFAAPVAALLLSGTTGCATYRTVSQSESDSAKVLSGTRLNLRTLAGESSPTKRFKAPAPAYPLLDLPFSFVLDVAILPLTLSVALYEVIFE